VQARPLFLFFFAFFFGAVWLAVFPRPLFLNFFFELKQIGHGPVLAPRTRRCWGEVRGAWPLPRRGREALEGRRSLSFENGNCLLNTDCYGAGQRIPCTFFL
jgi:hypothetical protein